MYLINILLNVTTTEINTCIGCKKIFEFGQREVISFNNIFIKYIVLYDEIHLKYCRDTVAYG
jgi:hypothetical protein